MTTSMTKALQKAGASIPANKRIWEWLKEHGEHTGAEVSAALNIPLGASSSLISQMKSRKMLKVSDKHSEHMGRKVGYYSTIGRTFEILPAPKKVIVAQAPINIVAEKTNFVENKVSDSTVDPDFILANMPVGKAFDLYKKLDNVFRKT